MKDIQVNVKKVLIVFLLLFIGLITYITYFEVFVGPKIVNNPLNKRIWAKRNEVLRGTIYDRNKKPLTKSEKINTLNQKREYTGGELFAHVLGYVDPIYGITGIEKKYDQDLMGAKELGLLEVFKTKGAKLNKVGSSLVTTLDYNIQKAAFDALEDNVGSVVAINPKNGEILAMVSKPSFDPNSLAKTWKDINSSAYRPLLNRAVAGLYPPGSTFKTITAISALEDNASIENKTFEDNGTLYFNSKYSLKNYNGETFGTIGFKNAFIHSSNVVFGGIGLDLGNDKLRATAEKLYFNKDIPVDGIAVDNSIFPSYKSYEKGNIAQSAIGQSGVLATPMQMALTASAVANDGVMMKPMLVRSILNSNGDTLRDIKPEVLSQVMNKNTSKVMKEMMLGVVNKGTGRNAQLDNVQVAGKTGTADHNDSLNGVRKPHSWFIGFAPYDNPQIAIAVIVENGGTGGSRAARVAASVIQATVK